MSALGDYLQVLSTTGTGGTIPEMKSPYLFLKKYRVLKGGLRRIYSCSTCFKALENDDQGEPLENQPCNHIYTKESHDGCYMLLLPVEEQLKYFIKNYTHKQKVSKDDAKTESSCCGDVHTGDAYRKLIADGVIEDNNALTCQLFFDGAEVFEESRFKMWPAIGVFNEASYKTRRRTPILFGVWFGTRKPPLDVYLDAIVEELNRLSNVGFFFEGTKYKLYAVILVMDTVARCMICGMMQFNGEFGCFFCLHPGIIF